MKPTNGLYHRIDGGIQQDIVKIVCDLGILQSQIPAAQHPHNGHILPRRGDFVNALAHGAEAQQSNSHNSLSIPAKVYM